MKRLIVALIGETGSGKSTFTSMCTEAEIHSIVAGEWGKKGTTKQIKRLLYKKDIEYDEERFEKAYNSENKEEVAILPLSAKIELGKFDALQLIDTQGLNDWKTKEEEERVYNEALDACDEADIIFAMIPDGGSVASTQYILDKLFVKYCHKPIILINKTVECCIDDLQYTKCDEIKKCAKNNVNQYKAIYSRLALTIEKIELPKKLGVGVPLLCLLPNSEELTSDKPVQRLRSNNKELRECINQVLQYAINLQFSLLEVMSDDYLEKNKEDIETVALRLEQVQYVLDNMKYVGKKLICKPYICHKNWKNDVEYSWQGGSRGNYSVRGGDYTNMAHSVYRIISEMISNLPVDNVGIKSYLFAILSKCTQDRYTPGTLNLQYASYTNGIPVKWLIDARTYLYNKHPNLFRNIKDDDFEGDSQIDHWIMTDMSFKNEHRDWDKLLEEFYFYSDDEQEGIKEKFGKDEWEATVMIWITLECINHINFTQEVVEKVKNEFWSKAFNKDGECKVWNQVTE